MDVNWVRFVVTETQLSAWPPCSVDGRLHSLKVVPLVLSVFCDQGLFVFLSVSFLFPPVCQCDPKTGPASVTPSPEIPAPDPFVPQPLQYPVALSTPS